MSDIPRPALDQLRGRLVEGIPRYERRRRRARLAQAVAGVGLVGALATAVVVGPGATGDTEAEFATGGGSGPCPAGPPGATVAPLSSGGVPAVLFAREMNGERVLVSDLDQGCRAVYAADGHTVDLGVVNADFTDDGRLVVQAYGAAPSAYPAGRDAGGQHALVAGGLAAPGEPFAPGATGELFLTDDGDAAWFMPNATDLDGDKALGFVDLATGDVSEVTVPAGSLLVDVDGDDAVLHPAAVTPSGDGGASVELAPGHDMLVVTPSGERSTLHAPEPAVFVTRVAGRTVWIAGGIRFRDAYCPCGDRLLVVADDGTTTTVPVPEGEAGQWRDPGVHALGSPSWRTVTSDGARLLLQLADPARPDAAPRRLVAVDLADGATHVFPVAGSTASWAGDDRTAIVVDEVPRPRADGSTTLGNVVTAVDTATGATTTIDGALPEGFLVVAVGEP